ncbi:MAG: insulinase family protein [Chitinophagales bacterium]
MHRITFFLSFLIFSNLLSAQNYFSENERYYQLTNGLELFLIQDKTQDGYTLSYTSKAGSYTESKELDGVTSFFSDIFFIKNIEDPSTTNNQEIFREGIQQESSCTEEYLNFSFNFSDKNSILTTLNFLKNQIEDTTITRSAIDYIAKTKLRNYRINREEPLLWGDYFNRVNNKIHPDSLNENLKSKLQIIQQRNLCTQNSLILISGNLDFQNTLELVQKTLGGLNKCNFNYFSQFPVPQPEPLRFNQQIVNYERTNFRAEYFFQGPTLRSDLTSVLAGALLNPLVKQELGMYDISFNIKTLNYANPATLSVKGDTKEEFLSNWEKLKSELLTNKNKLNILSKSKLDDIKTKMNQIFQTMHNNSLLKSRMVYTMWAYKDINFHANIMDKINALTTSDIQNLVDKYISDSNYILKLTIPKPGDLSDSSEIETAKSINDYELLFKKNSGALLDAKQDSIIENLLYFLNLNPKLKIKVVGIASKSELTSLKDKDTYKFTKKEFADFRIHPESLRPSSSKIRLDIYRTIKIAERLHNNGIELVRLFGSGRLEKEDTQENYKVYFREID